MRLELELRMKKAELEDQLIQQKDPELARKDEEEAMDRELAGTTLQCHSPERCQFRLRLRKHVLTKG